MIRGKKKVLENYSDKDLQSFETLKNFSKYNVNIIQTNYRQHSDQTERYNSSDNEFLFISISILPLSNSAIIFFSGGIVITS